MSNNLPLNQIIARDRAIRKKIRDGLAKNAILKEQGDAAFARAQEKLRIAKGLIDGSISYRDLENNGTQPS